jgi:hypothetical protein
MLLPLSWLGRPILQRRLIAHEIARGRKGGSSSSSSSSRKGDCCQIKTKDAERETNSSAAAAAAERQGREEGLLLYFSTELTFPIAYNALTGAMPLLLTVADGCLYVSEEEEEEEKGEPGFMATYAGSSITYRHVKVASQSPFGGSGSS